MKELSNKEFYISKKAGRAIMDYHMLDDGDKIAVAVSGGKDSLALLRILLDRRKFVPIKYSIIAVHVDMGYPKPISRQLTGYFRKLGVDYRIVKTDELKKTPPKDINCFWCAWNRRKILFQTADKLGCTKVALGHHMDDIIETTLMNMFFQAEISTMAPRQELFKGRIVIIRPLAYVEEKEIADFIKSEKTKVFSCKCPHSRLSQRYLMSRIISQVKKTCPEVKKNIFRSLRRIKKDYLL